VLRWDLAAGTRARARATSSAGQRGGQQQRRNRDRRGQPVPCGHLRDRLLSAVGLRLRVGEALGLRHEDIMAAGPTVAVVPRINGNGARSKSGQQRTIPVSGQVIRLYGDYLFTEYGNLDAAGTPKSPGTRASSPASKGHLKRLTGDRNRT
jgi:integrase